MVKQMKLKGTIALSASNMLQFTGRLSDGTPFEVPVDQFDIQLNEDFLPSRTTVTGFLFVVQEGQRADLAYVTLPKPSIKHGHHVTVKCLELMPRDVSLKDFGPKQQSGEPSL